jgi:hypothetical protein
MRFTVKAYNIMRIFEEISKAKNPDRIHLSDKKYNETLKKRQAIAGEKGGFVNPLFFHARIVRICSFTIRALQNAIMTGRSLIGIMDSLETFKAKDGGDGGTLMVLIIFGFLYIICSQ